MSPSPSVTGVQVESYVFPPTVKPPGSTKTLFLGGAGARGLEIGGKFVKFTAIGVYLEDNAISSLAVNWKGKTTEELTESVEFFRDIVTGAFEKFIKVTMILPLTGKQYSEKVAENCVMHWKAAGIYTDAEGKAMEKFIELFKDETFPPGSSILFTISSLGSFTVLLRASGLDLGVAGVRQYPHVGRLSCFRTVITRLSDSQISFSKDGTIPDVGNATIESKQLSEAVLESIIGKHGVSPEAKQSLAVRISDLLKQNDSKAVDRAVGQCKCGDH